LPARRADGQAESRDFRLQLTGEGTRSLLAGLRVTFGTNKSDANLGRLGYRLDMIDSCGLTAEYMYILTQLSGHPAAFPACAEVNR